jgi:hypothetical protein
MGFFGFTVRRDLSKVDFVFFECERMSRSLCPKAQDTFLSYHHHQCAISHPILSSHPSPMHYTHTHTHTYTNHPLGQSITRSIFLLPNTPSPKKRTNSILRSLHCMTDSSANKHPTNTFVFDRLLSNNLHNYILNPNYIPKFLKIARATLFPNNAPGPPRKAPDASEIKHIKRTCAQCIASILPPVVGATYFGLRGVDEPRGGKGATQKGATTREEAIIDEIDDLLDVLGDAYMNKHLIFGVISLVVLRLAPELGTKGVGELMRERVGESE